MLGLLQPGLLQPWIRAWNATLGAAWPTWVAFALVASGLGLLLALGVRHAIRSRSPGAREIEDLVRRAAIELDAKAERLERLIAQADVRLARLERVEPDPDVPAPATERRGPASAMGPTHAETSAELLTRRVCELSASGLSPREISRRLNEHQGKIELILALKRS